MNRADVLTGLAGLLAGAGIAAAVIAAQPADVAVSNPYSQSSFPCEEDEVLGYAPQFGSDHVGCIHIEEVR